MTFPEHVSGRSAPRIQTRDRLLAVLAVAAVAASITFWVVEASLGHDAVVRGLSDRLWWCAAILVVTWLVRSAERRLLEHFCRIEGAQYRDGYAAGYVDAASRRDGNHGRPVLRPVE